MESASRISIRKVRGVRKKPGDSAQIKGHTWEQEGELPLGMKCLDTSPREREKPLESENEEEMGSALSPQPTADADPL